MIHSVVINGFSKIFLKADNIVIGGISLESDVVRVGICICTGLLECPLSICGAHNTNFLLIIINQSSLGLVRNFVCNLFSNSVDFFLGDKIFGFSSLAILKPLITIKAPLTIVFANFVKVTLLCICRQTCNSADSAAVTYTANNSLSEDVISDTSSNNWQIGIDNGFYLKWVGA